MYLRVNGFRHNVNTYQLCMSIEKTNYCKMPGEERLKGDRIMMSVPKCYSRLLKKAKHLRNFSFLMDFIIENLGRIFVS